MRDMPLYQAARRRAGRVARAALRPAIDRLGLAPSPAPVPALPPDVETLVRSALFDHRWYLKQTGGEGSREDAAAHYLAQPRGVTRAHPHPLFDPEFYQAHLPRELRAEMEGVDPFVFYLRRRTWRRLTHPLFDTRGYLRRNPDALKHVGGVLRHYAEVGAPAGLRPNDWLPEDEDGRCPDLREWIAARHEAWRERRSVVPAPPWRSSHRPGIATRFKQQWADMPVPPGDPQVSVILDAGLDEELFRETLASVTAQQEVAWELLVVDRGGFPELTTLLHGISATVVPTTDDALAEGMNDALGRASAPYVAFVGSGEIWRPRRLRLLLAVAHAKETALVADVLAQGGPHGGTRFYAHGHPVGGVQSREAVELGRLLFRRDLLERLGGFDPAIRGAWKFDLVLRASHLVDLELVPVIGLARAWGAAGRAHRFPPARRSPADPEGTESWADVALNRSLIDWDDLSERNQDPDLVSVIVPTYEDAAMTTAAVESVMASQGYGGTRVQCIVWDNGSCATVSAALDALPLRFPDVMVVHSPVNHGFALGNNLALRQARGATIMFLNNDTTVAPDWLEPVRQRLADEDVLGVQSLLVYPDGTVQSAGVAFPSTGGLPHAFLQGFPLEDAATVDEMEFSALTGAALALRWADVVALRGFDPIFTNGMEDVDLCQRLMRLRERGPSFRVVSSSPVTHYESRSPGRYARSISNRRLYLDRWRGVDEPRDDVAKWGRCGYRVVDHELVGVHPGERRDVLLPQPVIVRAERLRVQETARRLRWAIKNPAPAGAEAEVWGDTHFARAIARALREHGQEVVVDHAPAFHRTTSRHDDVALVLRGLTPFSPSAEQVSIGWVISHPEMLSRVEATAYDRLLAASVTWAREVSSRWGIRVDPLLQATDPALFHPDRAVPDTGHPVIFVGGSRNLFRPIIRDAVAAGLPLSVYGHLWQPFLDKRYIKGEHLPNAELGAAYRSAGVVLNDHWDDMRAHGFLSNRLFDAVASGARVVTDDVAGLRDVFGDSVQVYRTPEDLTRLTSLADPAEVFGDDAALRAEAARIHRDHSFSARADRLIEIALEERKRRGFDN